MSKQVTFGHILTIMGLIIVPLLIWGVNVERRFEHVINNSNEIETLKIKSIDVEATSLKRHLEVKEMLHDIQLKLKDKKDRE